MRLSAWVVAVVALTGLTVVPISTTAAVTPSATASQCGGYNFDPQPDDAQRAAALMAGQVRMANFGAWRLPDDPAWTEDPFKDSNWVFQYHSLHWADPLRRVGLATGDDAMIQRYQAIVRDWVTDNPVADPPSRFSWYDMAVGFRGILLVCVAETYAGAEPAWLTDAIATHAQMLSDPSRYAGNYNHGLYQNIGLLALGCSRDVAEWRDLAIDRSANLLDVAVDAQGVTNEGSMEYQVSNYFWYQQLARALRSCGLPLLSHFDRVDRMPSVMAYATQPDGNLVAWGDTSAIDRGLSVPGTPAEYAMTGGRSGPRPAKTFAVFDRGYAFSRSGWYDTQTAEQQSLASIRFGEPRSQAVHAHQDSGAVSFFALGHQMLWQPGLYGGGGGAPRAYVVSNESHNVVDIAGAAYDNSAPTAVLAASGARTRDLVTVQSHSLQGATWQRTMVHAKVPGVLVVDDQVSQATNRTVRQLWQLGSDRTVTTGACRADSRGAGPNLTILWAGTCPRLSVAKGQLQPMLGWRSTHVNEFAPAPTVVGRTSGRTVRLTTVLVPRPHATAPRRVALLGSRTQGGRRTVDVRVGAKVYEIAFTTGTASVKEVPSPSSTTTLLQRQKDGARLTVRVTTATEVTATGPVSVRVGGRTITKRLQGGAATVQLPRLRAGRYAVRAAYSGSATVAPSRAVTRTYVVRAATAR